MDFYELMNQIKNNQLAPVYLINGEQTYLIEQLKQAFTNQIPADERTMNLASYDMEETPLADALNDASSAPFFGDHRLVFVTNPTFLTGERTRSKVDQNPDELVQYLKDPLKSTVLVILAPYPKLDARKKVVKALKQNATVVNVAELNEAQTRQYVQRTLKNRNYQIGDTALDHLIQRTDSQLSMIMNELPKLMIYCQADREISTDAVDNLVAESLHQNVFNLVDLVLKRQTVKAMELYQQLMLAGQAPLQINAILVGQFRLLLQTMILNGRGYTQGKLASSLRVHPYRIKLALRTVRRYHYSDLKNAFLGLVEIERLLKSTNRDPELLFEMFMLKFA